MKISKEKRQEQILKVAGEVFACNGYRRTDVQEIADKLKIGKGTIYRYFPTKENLFLSGVAAKMHQLSGSVINALESVTDPVKGIAAIIDIIFEFCRKNKEFIEMLLTERVEFKDRMDASFLALEKMRVKRIRETVIEGQKRGVFREISPDAISIFLVTFLSGIFITTVRTTIKELQKRKKEIIDIFMRGILTQQPVNERNK
ncbi:MAG: TetR/AcrR family transcriptional regulator [Planctomycetota bacterium]